MFKNQLYNFREIKLILLLMLVTASCKEVYNPHVQSPDTGYLVVEGFINSNGVTHIELTRTTKLVDTAAIIYEHAAQLFIESDAGVSYPLTEDIPGNYLSDSLTLNSNEKYRLHIKTLDGKEYMSDLSEVSYTPPIDSISWLRDNDGVHIYVNTHDEPGKSKYYKWSYVETWQYTSPEYSTLDWVYEGGVPVDYQASFYYSERFNCWTTIYSSNILLGSTEKLSANRIYLLLHNIEPASEKISVRYSILVKQNSISHDASLFYEKLRKNTEQLGSVFDAQPSELSGNIHCTTNTAETVIGFVETTTPQEKRIFISRNDVPDWGYNQQYCVKKRIPRGNVRDSSFGLLPVSEVGIDVISAASPECVDCTLRGGTNIKPDFWP